MPLIPRSARVDLRLASPCRLHALHRPGFPGISATCCRPTCHTAQTLVDFHEILTCGQLPGLIILQVHASFHNTAPPQFIYHYSQTALAVMQAKRMGQVLRRIKQFTADARHGAVIFSNENCAHTYVPRQLGQSM